MTCPDQTSVYRRLPPAGRGWGRIVVAGLAGALALGGCSICRKKPVDPAGPSFGPAEAVAVYDGVAQLEENHPVAQAQSQPAAALASALKRLEDEALPVEERTGMLLLATELGRHQKSLRDTLLKTAQAEVNLAIEGALRAPDTVSVAHLLAAYDAVLLASPSSNDAWARTQPLLHQLRGTGVEHRIVGKLAAGFPDLSGRAAAELGGADAPVPGARDTPPDFESFEDPDLAAEKSDVP